MDFKALTIPQVYPPPPPELKVMQCTVLVLPKIHKINVAVQKYSNALKNDTIKMGISTDCNDNPQNV